MLQRKIRGHWIQKLLNTIFRDFDKAIWFVEVAGDLGKELVRRDTDRCDKLRLVPDVLLNPAADFGSRAEQFLAAASVEERFIQRKRFDQRRVSIEYFSNLPRNRRVMVHPNGQHNSSRAVANCSRHRQRAVNAIFSRDVVGGRNDTSTFVRTADHDRLADKFRAIALFNRRVKRIHVDMQNHVDEIFRIRNSQQLEQRLAYSAAQVGQVEVLIAKIPNRFPIPFPRGGRNAILTPASLQRFSNDVLQSDDNIGSRPACNFEART